jgi:hypothetical protein
VHHNKDMAEWSTQPPVFYPKTLLEYFQDSET